MAVWCWWPFGMSLTGLSAVEPLPRCRADRAGGRGEHRRLDRAGVRHRTDSAATGAHAYPRENGITDLSPRSDLPGLADLNAGEHILCALTCTT